MMPWKTTSNLRTALFDFDGTLFDASEAIIRSFNTALREIGVPEWTPDQIRPLIGRPLLDMFPLAVPDADAALVNQLIASYRATFLPVSVSLTRALPGLRECVGALQRDGFQLGIVTNRARHGANHILEGFGLSDSFAQIVGLDDVTRGKPDPEPVRLALTRLGIPPERAVLIGDTRDDMLAARAAGVRGVGITTGSDSRDALTKSGATAVVSGLTDLPALLNAMLPSHG